jgi:multisubunit Na+/H+ antiporter MnhF subunit
MNQSINQSTNQPIVATASQYIQFVHCVRPRVHLQCSGRCGAQSCPELCLALEVTLSFLNSVAVTRFMVCPLLPDIDIMAAIIYSAQYIMQIIFCQFESLLEATLCFLTSIAVARFMIMVCAILLVALRARAGDCISQLTSQRCKFSFYCVRSCKTSFDLQTPRATTPFSSPWCVPLP